MSIRQHIRFCTARDGVRLAYATTGKGPALIKTGNWLTHLEFDLNSPVWGHLVEALSANHTVVRYDQRGTGLSDWEVDDISFEAWVCDLETVADACGFERFPLLGISQGVSVSVAYAQRHPERVSGLILHGGYARGRLNRGGGDALREEAHAMYKLAEVGWGKDDEAFRQFFTSQFIPGGTREQHHWFNELERICTSPANASRMMRVFDSIDVVAHLPGISCPTIVLHATRDLRVPFAEGRLIAGAIPQARFVPLDSANHLVLRDEDCWPHWHRSVDEFLRTLFARPCGRPFAALTGREHELLELIAQGRDNAQIAAQLQLSEKTVRNHITSIFAKLQVESRAQAIVAARNAGYGAAGS